MSSILHPFERAGLGLAPFRCVGVEHRVGPIKTTDPKFPGVTFEVGAPGQPMGTCDYCGTGIADCYVIRSADGKKFVVGSDCVMRTYSETNTAIPVDIRRAIAEVRRQKNEKRNDARRARELATLTPLLEEARAFLAANPTAFAGEPHPMISGKTRRDYFEFLLGMAGNATRIATCRTILGRAK